jgi:hypothetical protein
MSARPNPAAVALVRRCWSLMVRSNWYAVATLPLEVLHRGATAGRRKTGHCKALDPPCRAIGTGCAYSKARCRRFHRVMSDGMSPYEIYYVLATDKEISA